MFLEYIDSTKSWSEHIQHVLIFCRVHIQRKLYQKFRNASEYTLMCQLCTETNKSKFDTILRQLMNSSSSDVRNWATHKNVDWIRAGMSRCYTKMPAASFDSFEKSSNLVESTHHSTNLGGIGVSLLAGIKEYVKPLSLIIILRLLIIPLLLTCRSQAIDENRINTLNESIRFGARDSYKVTTPISRKRRAMGQPGKPSSFLQCSNMII
jgi:hypothetical protein